MTITASRRCCLMWEAGRPRGGGSRVRAGCHQARYARDVLATLRPSATRQRSGALRTLELGSVLCSGHPSALAPSLLRAIPLNCRGSLAVKRCHGGTYDRGGVDN